jgi:hypothetical protein
MFASCWLLAAATDSKPPISTWLWTILILTAVVLAAGILIMSVGRWAKRPGSDSRSSGEELASFRVLYERGEFSQDEYDRIRSRLSQKLRNELKVPTEQPAQTAAAEPAPGNGLSAAPLPPTIDRPDSAGPAGESVAPGGPDMPTGAGPDSSTKPG